MTTQAMNWPAASQQFITNQEMEQLMDQHKIQETMQKVAALAATACTIHSTKVDQRQRALAILRNHLFCLLSALTRNKYDVTDVVSCLQAANETYLQEFKKHQSRIVSQSQTIQHDQQQQVYDDSRVSKNEFSQSLIEQIWMKNAEHSAQSPDSNVLSWSLKQFVNLLIERKIVTVQELKEQLDVDTLAHCQLINDKQVFERQIKAVNTARYFAQKKYNLLREENEGFAKLIIEINQITISQDNWKVVFQNIQKLVGYFSLDPNRVLELILSSFENNLWNQVYLQILREFKQGSITQLVGFKLQNELGKLYPRRIEEVSQDGKTKEQHLDLSVMDPDYEFPETLFLMIALLLKHKIIDLADIWPHFNLDKKTDEDEVQKLISLQSESLEYQYKMLFTSIMNKEAYEKEIKSKRAQQDIINEKRRQMPNNFRLRLIKSCIDANNWVTVDEIFELYDQKLDLSISQPLLDSLYNALEWVILPLYQKQTQATILSCLLQLNNNNKKQIEYFEDLTNEESLKQAHDSETLFAELPKVLSVLNVYLGFNQKLFYKVCSVIKASMNSQQTQSAAYKIAGEVLLPALSLVGENFALEQQVWSIMKNCPFQQRYSYYSRMLERTYLSNPQLMSKMILVYRDVQQWNKRLNMDMVKSMGRQLSKMACGNAIIVFDQILKNAKSYDNMIETQIQALSHCQPLSMDIMTYTLVRHLADSQDPPLDREANTASWLNNLSEFASSYFKKFWHVDMLSIFTFLDNRMTHNNEFSQMHMFKEIISKMFGWSEIMVTQLPMNQLQALAGGFILRLEIMSQASQFKKNSKSGDALVSLFWEKSNDQPFSLAFKLMAHLAQQTQYIQTDYQSDQLIVINRLFDRTQLIFSQFVDTLVFLSNSPQKYGLLLPEAPEKALSLYYRLPPQYTFHIMRSSLVPIHQLTPEALKSKVEAFRQVLDYHYQARLQIVTPELEEESEYWDEKAYLNVKKQEIWKYLKPELYAIFWYLQLKDILVPEKTYKEEINKINTEIESLKVSSERSQKKNMKEIERLQKLQKQLNQELTEFLQKNQTATYEYLKKEIPKCFEQTEDLPLVSNALIQYCFYPRLMYSASDALYTFNFFKLLYQLRVPNYNILYMLGAMLKSFMPAIHCCSESEAENLGIFFMELFQLLNHWLKKSNWDRECKDYKAFSKAFNQEQCISHEEFIDKISESINRRFAQNLMICFQKEEKLYMKTRCSLIILNRMSPVFPNSYQIANAIQERLQKLVDAKHEIKNDLWTIASRCNEELKKKVASFPQARNQQAARQQQQQQQQVQVTPSQQQNQNQSGQDQAPQRQIISHNNGNGSGGAAESSQRNQAAYKEESKKDHHQGNNVSTSQQDKKNLQNNNSVTGNDRNNNNQTGGGSGSSSVARHKLKTQEKDQQRHQRIQQSNNGGGGDDHQLAISKRGPRNPSRSPQPTRKMNQNDHHDRQHHYQGSADMGGGKTSAYKRQKMTGNDQGQGQSSKFGGAGNRGPGGANNDGGRNNQQDQDYDQRRNRGGGSFDNHRHGRK